MRLAVSLLLSMWSASASAQDSRLTEAQALYEEASFEEALELLDAAPAELPVAERPRWAELRAVVLFALRSDEHGDALIDLAMLAPGHRLSPGLPPEIYTAFEMARAHVRDPEETSLARARARYFVADFEGALRLLDDMREDVLTRQQWVERTVLHSLALFALQRRDDCRNRLSDLATVAPSYRFDRRVPPAFRALWNEARGGVRSLQREG